MTQRVYFSECFTLDGTPMKAIKIGTSKDPVSRQMQISLNLPFKCKLLCDTTGDLVIESLVHKLLKKHKISGEYFHKTEEVMAFVGHVSKTGKLPIKVSVGSTKSWAGSEDVNGFLDKIGSTYLDVSEFSKKSMDAVKSQVESFLSYRMQADLIAMAVEKGFRLHYPKSFYKGNPWLRRAS